MKLIDVDNFLKQYSNQIPGDTIDAIDLRLALLKEPKVEAIPVEWLKRWFEFQVWCGSSLTDRVHCKASDIIGDWKKENMLKEWEKDNDTN